MVAPSILIVFVNAIFWDVIDVLPFPGAFFNLFCGNTNAVEPFPSFPLIVIAYL